MAKRTTHRSSTGRKLYAVRGKGGKFKDIQTYQRAHAADMRRQSKAEVASGAQKKTRKKGRKK
jgi:hypothetical protein